jgi:two-component system cell cycle sensor histidine kinase/response regulator CckA
MPDVDRCPWHSDVPFGDRRTWLITRTVRASTCCNSRSRPSDTRSQPAGTGTGLGLSIVLAIITDQRGGISVKSVRGRGTTMEIFLPLTTGSTAESVSSEAEIPTGREVILVVEDNAAVRAAVRTSLERFGYTVLEASDGAQALRASSLQRRPTDLLLTDLMMPEVTGRALVEQLERDGRMPKVLLMSGYADDDVIRRGLKDARYPFIQKPFTREALARKVREVLDAPAEARRA